jgi:DNA (cytosine-5)-methyltransferase 1
MPSSTTISLYTGAGGLDLGLEAAGFKLGAAVEFDAKACDTLRANRKWHVLNADIHEVSSKALSAVSGLSPEQPALLAGGPPCQPFSKAAYWRSRDTKRLSDPRADTLLAYLRVLRDLRPRAFLLENVHGLAFSGKDEGLRLLRENIASINRDTGTRYSFAVQKLNAADYGIPQTRERVIIIGARDGTIFKFPAPTHRAPEESSASNHGDDRQPWITAWDAMGDLENDPDDSLRVGGRWGDLLPSIPEGQNYLWHTNRGGGRELFGWRRRYWGFLLKLAKNRPAWTVQAQPGTAIGPFHWKSRKLSARELCRLQTFPDSYQIVGSRGDAQRQLGNAVPALLGEILGREIRKQLLGERVRLATYKLAVGRRPDMPPPERIAPVPVRYLKLVGDHAAHPGTGKGYSVAPQLSAKI